METTIRWGILGPGNIARRFATQLPHSSTGTFYAAASRSLEQAQKFVTEFEGEKAYGSYDELLADPQVDAVYISTVHTNHHELTIRAAAAGKHVVCEKPLAVNHAWAMASVEAARDHGTFLAEAYMYRFHPQTAKIRELVESGVVGDVFAIEASFAFNNSNPQPGSRLFSADLAGGGILDVGGYPVSMARMIAGAAVGQRFLDPETVDAVGSLSAGGVDEWAVARLTFPGGVTARVSTGIRAQDANAVTVYGSKGHLVVSDPWMLDPTAAGLIVVTTADSKVESIETPSAYAYALEADSVGVRGDSLEAPEITWADSLGTAKVLDAWRGAIGLEYPFEARTADVPSVSASALGIASGRSQAPMVYGEIPGVSKRISKLVMGCDNQQTLTHASVMFDDFVERGGNTFDTGYIYGGGRIEPLLGQWMTNRGNRDDVVVIGKGAHTPHCDPESITRQLNETLDRLQTDHVDLYMMHRDNLDIPVGEFVDVLDEHQRAGRITVFGGSNWTIDRFTEANRYARANGKHGFVMLSNHFGLARAHDVPWAGCEHVTDPASRAWLTTHDVPLLPWSSQARGFFAPGRSHPEKLDDAELVRCYYSDENFERLRRAEELGAELGVLATAIALAYVIHQPFPTFALIGPRTLTETRTSTDALSITLTQAQLDWLDLTSDEKPA